VTGRELARDVRDELRSLSAANAERVARHLVMVRRLFDQDAEAAYQHARAAQRSAGRIGAVRETLGLAAYRTGRYAEALAELRAARRISGSLALLPVMADSERGLGRPERALTLAGSSDVRELDKAGQVEMRIVAAGARRDLGQFDAAILTLQIPELNARSQAPWLARLRYAYADALYISGKEDEARKWFALAAEVDTEGETDAPDRLAELDGVTFVDVLEQVDDEAGEPNPEDGPATDQG
jgi:tetratricopeptide (TPR) repeat protein